MVSFVILHYKNMKDTIECIESINKLKINKDYSIVVVDNASMNREDAETIKKYVKDVLLLKKNVGFANGNNAGCKYAIDKYNPDFLIVINNDTLILQDDFVDRIYKCYNQTKFDILGPKILTNGGESVNPFPVYKTLDEIRRNINKSKKLIKIYSSPILRILLNTYMLIKKQLVKPLHLTNGSVSMKNVALHGCALIFSKKYYQKYNDIFYMGTFLYHEEEFLEYRRKKDSLITYYDCDIEIFHKEGSSLETSFNKSKYKKLVFKNKYIIDSLSKLEEIIQKNISI